MKILSLDGGGAKGLYTLGILLEVEALIKKEKGVSIAEYFDVIYGTSTGSIIATLLALNEYSVNDIKNKYLELIPKIMSKKTKCSRSTELEEAASSIFGDKTFDVFKETDICIVTTNISDNTPLIFKSNSNLAHSSNATFKKGFDKKISEAIVASCAAYPLFKKVELKINDEIKTLIDGGFVANNPSLFALLDALKENNNDDIELLSIGVGQYPEKKLSFINRSLIRISELFLTEKILECNSNINNFIVNNIFSSYPKVKIVRINDTYSEKKYETNLLETETEKLKQMFALGKKSYQNSERELKQKFNL